MNLDFLIVYSRNKHSTSLPFGDIAALPLKPTSGIYLPKDNAQQPLNNHKLIIGDCINSKDLNSIDYTNTHKQKGNFYLIQLYRNNVDIVISTSFGSLLPLYKYENDQNIFISSSIRIILPYINNTDIDKGFLLELALFNYSFSKKTIIEQIHLIPTHHACHLQQGKLRLEKVFDISELFNSAPYKKSLKDVCDAFEHNILPYFPSSECTINFTSGFDGRTLVALGLHNNKLFDTYSFGKKQYPDVSMPLNQSSELELKYNWLDLDDRQYVNNYYVRDSLKLIHNHALLSNTIYTHFYTSAFVISQSNRYLLTGYMGSELYRALHIAGAVTSTELFHFFNSEDDSWINKIRHSPKLRIFQNNILHSHLDEVIEQLHVYKKTEILGLSKNQRFYRYVFEEVFRKFFGSLIKIQSDYLTVRSPFLDYEFLNVLLQSKFAGVNNDFFTHNPLKRLKGQVVYAELLKRNSQPLYKMNTGKGYAPSDLGSPIGKIKLIKSFITKITHKRMPPDLDNLGLLSGFTALYNSSKQLYPEAIFNRDYCSVLYSSLYSLPEYQRDLLFHATSASIYLNHLGYE